MEKPKPTRTLSELKVYRQFKSERDQALERIHTYARMELSDILRGAMNHALLIVSYRYDMIAHAGFFVGQARAVVRAIDDELDKMFSKAASDSVFVIQKLKRTSFFLAAAGEAEAIGRALNRKTTVDLNRNKLDAVAYSKTQRDENLSARSALAYARIRRKIIDAVEQARVREEDREQALIRVRAALPKAAKAAKPPRILKHRTREAEGGIKPTPDFSDLILDFSSAEEWDDAINAYKNEYVPKWRSTDKPFDVDVGQSELQEYYPWEIEKEATHEFVTAVRKGEVDAATANGITDFVFIAIVDNRTDECCLVRDGYLLSEIEDMIAKGKIDSELCDGAEPPLHENCRCRLAPATDDIPEKPASIAGDFEQWLMTN